MSRSVLYNKVLPPPAKTDHLPGNIHWLSGEGCGSWFHIEKDGSEFIISRYSPEGKVECKGLFKQVSGHILKLYEEYCFTYLSHCSEVNIVQDGVHLKFKLICKIK